MPLGGCRHIGCIRSNGSFAAVAEKETHECLCLHRVVSCGASVSSCKQLLQDWITRTNTSEDGLQLMRCEAHNSSLLIYAVKEDDRVLIGHILKTVSVTSILECFEAETSTGDTALILASRMNRSTILAAFLHYLCRHSSLALVHRETTRGSLPLIEATKENHFDCVKKLLIEGGADPTQPTKVHGKCALDWASRCDREDILKELERQSKVLQDTKRLFQLIACGDVDAVKEMVQEGESFAVIDSIGYLDKLLHYVCEIRNKLPQLEKYVQELPAAIEEQEIAVQLAKRQSDQVAAELQGVKMSVDLIMKRQDEVVNQCNKLYRESFRSLNVVLTVSNVSELASMSNPGTQCQTVAKALCLLLDAGRDFSAESDVMSSISMQLDEYWIKMIRAMENLNSFSHRLRHYDLNHRLSAMSAEAIGLLIDSGALDVDSSTRSHSPCSNEKSSGGLQLLGAITTWVKTVHFCRQQCADIRELAKELVGERERLESFARKDERCKSDITIAERRKSMLQKEANEGEKKLALTLRSLRLAKKKIHIRNVMSHVTAAGHSLLSWASAYGSTEITNVLLDHGAHLGLGDAYLNSSVRLIQATFRMYLWNSSSEKQNAAPFDIHKREIAYRLLNKTIGRLLRDRRAHVRSPLAEAYCNGHAEVAAVLEKKAALLHIMMNKPRHPCGVLPRRALPMVRPTSATGAVVSIEECIQIGQRQFDCDSWKDGTGWIRSAITPDLSRYQVCTQHFRRFDERLVYKRDELSVERDQIRSKTNSVARLNRFSARLDNAIRCANYLLMASVMTEEPSLSDWENQIGMTPLVVAAMEEQEVIIDSSSSSSCPLSAVAFLLDRQIGRPTIDFETNDGGETALYAAAKHGRVRSVEDLLDRGAGINTTSSANGETALHAAAREGKEDVTILLLERGASTSIKDQRGRTARDVALEQGHITVVGAIAQSDRKHMSGIARAQYGTTLHRFPCQWGCGLIDEEERLLDHDKECPRRPYACPLCWDGMEARDRREHDEFHCSERPVTCTLCHERIPASNIALHESNECSKRIVACPRERCSIHLKAEILDKHMNYICDYRMTPCGNCQIEVAVKDMRRHRLFECQRRQIRCHKCNDLVLASELQYHEEEECPQRSVACPYCQEVFLLSTLDKHTMECAKAQVSCSNSKNGCEWIGSRDFLTIHLHRDCLKAFRIACPNGCGVFLRQDDVPNHIVSDSCKLCK